MQNMQQEVMPTLTKNTNEVNITLKGVIKVARKLLSYEDNFKLHEMITVWGEQEMLMKAIAFVSKRHPLTVAEWIAEIST